MAVQIRNSEQVNLLRADFVHKTDHAYAWALAPSLFLALPRVAGYWPMSAGYTSDARNLVRVDGVDVDLVASAPTTYGQQGLTPYLNLSGSNYLLLAGGVNNYYSLATAFTVGGWFYVGGSAFGTLMSAYKETDRGWRLAARDVNLVEFLISNNGATFIQWRPTAPFTRNTWCFIAARYTPSTEMALWVNNTKYTNTSSIYASLNPANASLSVGGQADGFNLMTGRAAHCFVCATALPDVQLQALYSLTRSLFNV